MLASAANSVLILVDVQPKFLAPIYQAERVLDRSKFLLQVAQLADIPVFATEQYPERMGPTHESLLPFAEVVEPKMRFSCFGCKSLEGWLADKGKKQVIVAGIETHICVNQTVHHLQELGFDAILAEDAISARTAEMHANGIARMRTLGATVAHSESIAYEWLQGADHPKFRQLLEIVKSAPTSVS